MVPEEDLNRNHWLLNLSTDIWQAFAAYLTHDQLTALAMTSQLAARRVRELREKGLLAAQIRRQPGHYLSLSQEQPLHEIKLQPLPEGDWRLVDMALPTNGLWLFVVHQQGGNSLCVDIYQRESREPLNYRHVERAPFNMPIQLESEFKFIIGMNNTPGKPGIYFMNSELEIFSHHLGNTEPSRLKLPDALREQTRGCVVQGNAESVRLFCLDRTVIHGYTLSREGDILSTLDYPLTTALALRTLALSPNGHHLLDFETRPEGAMCHIRNTLNGVETDRRICRFQGNFPLSSITDDGHNILIEDKVYCLRNELDFTHPNDSISQDIRPIVVHSGNGRIALTAYQGKVRQLFLEQCPFSVDLLAAVEYVASEANNAQNGPLYTHGLLTFCGLPATNPKLHHNLELIRQQIPVFDVPTMAKLLKELPNLSLGNLCIIADYFVINNEPMKSHITTLRTKEDGWTLCLQGLFENWERPREIQTHDLGIVRSGKVLIGSRREFEYAYDFCASDLIEKYASSKMGSEKQRLFARIDPSRDNGLKGNPLLCCAQEIKPGLRVADAFCLSRNEKWDRQYKKLIPRSFSQSLKKYDSMRHYINFDAVLLKLIGWLSDGKYKNDLDAARKRMCRAVQANPSLLNDINQLWHTEFFGGPSINSCLKDPTYRRQIIRSFNIDKHYSFEPIPAPQP